MRDMTAKLQDGYKNNAMHVNPKHKWCMKKIGQILKKTENFSLLKAQYFMNEMHEYEIKSFSKTVEFNPDLSKKLSIKLSPKFKN